MNNKCILWYVQESGINAVTAVTQPGNVQPKAKEVTSVSEVTGTDTFSPLFAPDALQGKTRTQGSG